MKSSIISKIRIFNPNKRGASSANKEHCLYIGTRPGVDLTNIESNNETHLEYIHYRPRSHGLFGNINCENINEIANSISKLSKDKKLVYRGIVSLCEDDARELGYLEKKKWKMLLDSTMPEIAKTFGISIEKLEWVGAFHFEKDHPHAHYMFWDKGNRVASPYIHVSKQHKCREIFSKEIFRDERENLIIEKTLKRDMLIDFGKDIVDQEFDFLNNLFIDELSNKKIPDRIYQNEVDEISYELLKLVNNLPEHGRIAYAYMPKDIKEHVDKISNLIFERKDISKEYSEYLNNTEQIAKSYSVTDNKNEWMKENAIRDINKRIGNLILKTAKNLRKNSVVLSEKNLQDMFPKYNKSQYNENEDYQIDDGFNDESLWNLDNIESYYQQEQYYEELNESYINSSSLEHNEYNTDNYSNEKSSNNKKLFDNYNTSISKSKYRTWTKQYKTAKKIIYSNTDNELQFKEALQILEDEANNHNCLALYDLAHIYEEGINVSANQEQANSLYKKSFNILHNIVKEENNSYFKYKLGKMYNQGKGIDIDYKKAAYYFKQASDEGNSFAQYSLAGLYKTGRGVEQNNSLAFNYYSKAAENDNTYALLELGQIYSKGISVNVDQEKAFLYNTKAFKSFLRLDMKNPDALVKYRIGKMYIDGIGTTKNIDLGIKYLEEAANLNNEYALNTLSKIYLDKNSKYFSVDYALKYLNKGAKLNNKNAQYNLGKLYLNKDYGIVNISKGIKLLQMSADNDNLYAGLTLAEFYYKQSKTYFNIDKVKTYLSKASQSENSYVLYALGKLYLNKNYESYDIEKGISCLEKASNLNNDNAQLLLAKIYLNKEDKYYNFEKGIKFLKKSIDNGNEFAKATMVDFSLDKSNQLYNPDYAKKLLNDLHSTNNSFIQYKLGKLFMDKESIYYDPNKGISYLLKAAKTNEYAKIYLAKLYLDKTSKLYNINAAQFIINDLTKSSNNGYIFFSIAKIHLNKDSEIYNVNKGFNYLHKALEKGYDEAYTYLGKIHSNTETQFYNPDLANMYFKKALNTNSKIATYHYAKFLLNENTNYYNVNKALSLLEYEAIKNNNSYAQLELGKLYYFGKHIKKDKEKSDMWINKALGNGNKSAQDFLDYCKEYKENLIKTRIISASYQIVRSCFDEMTKENDKVNEIYHKNRKRKKHKKHFKEKNIEKEY